MRYISREFMFLVVLFIFLSPATAFAKSGGRVSGMIKNASGSPLRDAIIRIVREAEQGEFLSIVKTDNRGFFKSVSLNPGTYYLLISRQGYQPVTTAKFVLDSGRTTSLDIVLQEFIGFLSNNEDPRNWDLKTVLRSTSDRRLIFRDLQGAAQEPEDASVSFDRSGAMKIASNSSLDDGNYFSRPQTSQTGVSSNFAIAEPLGQKSRMILSGQLDFGHGTFWRIRDTFNYRPDRDHDYRLSVGYGQMNVNYPGTSSLSSQIMSEEGGLRESSVRTLAFGVEGTTNFLDLLSVKYGFDYSRLHYGNSRSFFYPSLQVVFHPLEDWSIRTSFASRRLSDSSIVELPDGEILSLAEPTLITMVGNRISMSQIRHSEISASKAITRDTALELAVYQDRFRGPGLPIMITTITPTESKSQVVEMNEDYSGQRGVRITLRRKLSESLRASVDYVYGDALNIVNLDGIVSSDLLDGNLAAFLHQRNQHSITGRINATVPCVKTRVLATLRWYPGNPLTPVDWFSDQMDIGTKSTNFELRQAFPMPDFISTAGRWEILVDLRNVLNQGREILPTKDGEIVLNRNPRSLRFGLNLSFH